MAKNESNGGFEPLKRFNLQRNDILDSQLDLIEREKMFFKNLMSKRADSFVSDLIFSLSDGELDNLNGIVTETAQKMYGLPIDFLRSVLPERAEYCLSVAREYAVLNYTFTKEDLDEFFLYSDNVGYIEYFRN